MRMVSGLRRRIAPVAAVLLPAYLAACFHYVPVDAGWMPPPGANIRAGLSTPQAFNLGTETINDVQSVEGTVVETYPDSLGLWVRWLHPKVGERFDANLVEFSLPRGSITQLEYWRVSGRQTAVLGVVTVGAVVGLLRLVSWAVGKNSSGLGDKPGDVTTQIR